MRGRNLIAGALLVVGAITAILSRPDSDPYLLGFAVRGETAYGNGYTSADSAGVIERLLRNHPGVTRLVFENMPGTVDADINRRIARDIRRAGLNTALTPESRIASGAVTLFLAGVEREVACGARIGVHAWGSALYDGQTALIDNFARPQRRLLASFGLDPDFYDFTVASAPPEGIHWMSDAEIVRWNVTTEPRDCE